MVQIKKIAFSVLLIFVGAASVLAQRDDRDRGERQSHPQNNNQRAQQPVNRQRQRSFNRAQVNRQPQQPVTRQAPNRRTVNQAPINRTQINRTQVNVNPTRTVNRNVTTQSYARATNRPGYRPQGWAPTRRAYTRPPVVYGGKRFYAYHRYYPHPFVSYSYGPRWHPIGFFLSALVGTAIAIDLENRSYRYADGVFYAPYNNGYQVVPAPPGAAVPSLPQGYQQVAVGGQSYYYFGGAFFVLNGNQYEVVQAPPGAVVYSLPQGAMPVQVDSYNYVQYNGTYYQPIQINGQDAYEVVEMEPDSQQ